MMITRKIFESLLKNNKWNKWTNWQADRQKIQGCIIWRKKMVFVSRTRPIWPFPSSQVKINIWLQIFSLSDYNPHKRHPKHRVCNSCFNKWHMALWHMLCQIAYFYSEVKECGTKFVKNVKPGQSFIGNFFTWPKTNHKTGFGLSFFHEQPLLKKGHSKKILLQILHIDLPLI